MVQLWDVASEKLGREFGVFIFPLTRNLLSFMLHGLRKKKRKAACSLWQGYRSMFRKEHTD